MRALEVLPPFISIAQSPGRPVTELSFPTMPYDIPSRTRSWGGLAWSQPSRRGQSLASPDFEDQIFTPTPLRLPNALNSEERGLKVRFSLATIVFETFELILCQMLSSQGKNAPSNPYPHYLVRLATSRPQPQSSLVRIFRLQPGLERKFLLRRTWSGTKIAPTAVSRTFTPLVRGIRFP